MVVDCLRAPGSIPIFTFHPACISHDFFNAVFLTSFLERPLGDICLQSGRTWCQKVSKSSLFELIFDVFLCLSVHRTTAPEQLEQKSDFRWFSKTQISLGHSACHTKKMIWACPNNTQCFPKTCKTTPKNIQKSSNKWPKLTCKRRHSPDFKNNHIFFRPFLQISWIWSQNGRFRVPTQTGNEPCLYLLLPPSAPRVTFWVQGGKIEPNASKMMPKALQNDAKSDRKGAEMN